MAMLVLLSVSSGKVGSELDLHRAEGVKRVRCSWICSFGDWKHTDIRFCTLKR